jgi:hypothetical protein
MLTVQNIRKMYRGLNGHRVVVVVVGGVVVGDRERKWMGCSGLKFRENRRNVAACVCCQVLHISLLVSSIYFS